MFQHREQGSDPVIDVVILLHLMALVWPVHMLQVWWHSFYQLNPALAGKVDLIENIIESTANPKTTNQACGSFDGSKIPNAVYGYGRIDALAAAKMAQKLLSETKDDASLNMLKINPDPSSENINVILTSVQSGLQEINIFDANGKKITQLKLSALTNTFEIDISEFTPGMYLLLMLLQEIKII